MAKGRVTTHTIVSKGKQINVISQDIIDALKSIHPDIINIQIQKQSTNGVIIMPALIWAIKNGQKDVVEKLVEKGVDKNINYNGKTALQFAEGKEEIIETLKGEWVIYDSQTNITKKSNNNDNWVVINEEKPGKHSYRDAVTPQTKPGYFSQALSSVAGVIASGAYSAANAAVGLYHAIDKSATNFGIIDHDDSDDDNNETNSTTHASAINQTSSHKNSLSNSQTELTKQ